MATIREKGPYQFHVQVRKKGHAPATRTFPTRREAEDWAVVIESEMIRGVFVNRAEIESTALSEVLKRYKREVTPPKKGAKREEQRIDGWLSRKLADRMLASIRGADIAKFRDDWRKEGKAENTIRLEIALLSHVFETCRKDWGMEGLQNPCKSINLPKNSTARDRRLEAGEADLLIAEIGKSRNRYMLPLVRLALETAMRQGELLDLTWENVHLAKRIVVLPDTKNGLPRTVPLSTMAHSTLSAMPRPIEGGRVFPLRKDNVRSAWEAACTRAKIEDLRFHDLRHEAASRLFEKGLNPMEVASITGHKTLQMLKRYTHLRAEDLAKKLG